MIFLNFIMVHDLYNYFCKFLTRNRKYIMDTGGGGGGGYSLQILVGMCRGKVKYGQGLRNELPVKRGNVGLRNELDSF